MRSPIPAGIILDEIDKSPEGVEHEVFPLWENALSEKIPMFFKILWCEVRDSNLSQPAVTPF